MWKARGAYASAEWNITSDNGVVTTDLMAGKMLEAMGREDLHDSVSFPPIFGYQSKGDTDDLAVYANIITMPGLLTITGDLPAGADTLLGPSPWTDTFDIDPSRQPVQTQADGTKVLPLSYFRDSDPNDPEDVGHTGGMIALIPTVESQKLLSIPGGESEDELHLTLMYLGDNASVFTEAQRDIMRAITNSIAGNYDGPINTEVSGAGQLGDGGATVYLVGDSDQLQYVYEDMAMQMGIIAPLAPIIQPQRMPWIPHVTGAYNMSPSQLTYRGPVAFDRIRIVFGDERTDCVIGSMTPVNAPMQTEDKKSLEWGGKHFMVAEPEDPQVKSDHLLTSDWNIAWDTFRFLKSNKPATVSEDPRAARLRLYWTKGKGAAKIGWGTPGDFERAVTLLRPYVGKRAEGLAANYHKVATGFWPGHAPGEGGKSLPPQAWKDNPILAIYTDMAMADTIDSHETEGE